MMNNEDKILQILGELKTDVSELKRGQTRLEARVSDLSADVTELKAGQFEIRDNLTVINKNVISIWGHLINQNRVLSEIQGE
ncbi:MAG: hypothetical protein LBT12_05225 [Oscillospiraceae bacterium]|jgi:hypothetical protein|nr:hypothetical protein [Oscillospiraceae bacterium]